MSWRSQGVTGSNSLPLGKTRRLGADEEVASLNGPTDRVPSAAPDRRTPDYRAPDGDRDLKRGRSPERSELHPPPTSPSHPEAVIHFLLLCEPSSDKFCLFPGTEADGPKPRKKRNRWGDASENKAAGLMGLPTAIMANMTSEQLEAYTLHLRIEEISQKLRIDDVVPADGDRYVANISIPSHSSLAHMY